MVVEQSIKIYNMLEYLDLNMEPFNRIFVQLDAFFIGSLAYNDWIYLLIDVFGKTITLPFQLHFVQFWHIKCYWYFLTSLFPHANDFDEIVVDWMIGTHVGKDMVQLKFVQIACIAISVFIKRLPVEDAVIVRQHS